MGDQGAVVPLSVSFNQDCSCVACGTTTGFRVFTNDPFKETYCRGFDNGGIGIVEMLFRCNILALVGGGPAPKYPPTKVMIWDDHQGRCIGELSFRSQVRAVRLRRDRIVVALEHKVLVYNFADLKLLHQIETLTNPKGLVAVSSAADSTVLVCPGLHTGQIRIELYDRRLTKFISAHTNALACLALSMDGKRLASASEKGTLVRVWSTAEGTLLQELRRGADPATIHSLAFSRFCEWLAVSSDKGTVHIFGPLSDQVTTAQPGSGANGTSASHALAGSPAGATHGNGSNGSAAADVASAGGSPPHPSLEGGGAGGQQGGAVEGSPGAGGGAGGGGRSSLNPTSLFSMVKGLVPSVALPKYFSSEWSFAQFRVPGEEASKSHVIVGFGPQPNTLLIITSSGSFYKVSFDPVKGGQCTQESYTRFLESPMGTTGFT